MAGMSRRHFLARGLVFGGGLCLLPLVRAETYLSGAQAQQLIYPGQALRAVDEELAVHRFGGRDVRVLRQ